MHEAEESDMPRWIHQWPGISFDIGIVALALAEDLACLLEVRGEVDFREGYARNDELTEQGICNKHEAGIDGKKAMPWLVQRP